MPYEISLQDHKDYVRVHVKGERRYGDAATEAGEAGRKIVQYCRDANIYRVLVILELTGRMSAVDSIEMVADSQHYGWDRSFKLAFVVTSKQSVADVEFTETVAVNRGYPVKAFTDEAEAVAWLIDK